MATYTTDSKTKEIKRQIEHQDHKRYVLSVVSGQETLVVKNIKEAIRRQEMENDVIEFLIPSVLETKITKTKKMVKERKLYPWYVFVKSKMNEKIRYVVRNTPWVRIIVWAETHPIPLTDREYQNILQQMEDNSNRAEMDVPFMVWEVVKIKKWDFVNMEWSIKEIDKEKWLLTLNIEILWRITPVTIEFDKVELK